MKNNKTINCAKIFYSNAALTYLITIRDIDQLMSH